MTEKKENKKIAVARPYEKPEPKLADFKEEKKKDSPAIAITTIIIAGLLALASFGWLWGNIDEIFGPLFDRDDPEPTPTVAVPTPDGAVEAALYAECQDQLADVLAGEDPIISEAEKIAHEEYLHEARRASILLGELAAEGRIMFSELEAREDTPGWSREDWNQRAARFRADLYEATNPLHNLGMSEAYVRIHSEIFLAYRWLDLFSDEINGFFTDSAISSVSTYGLSRAEGHLKTANDLLSR